MKNINSTLLDRARTSIFIAHRLRTVVEAGLFILHSFSRAAWVLTVYSPPRVQTSSSS